MAVMPIVETKRLRLRSWAAGDLEAALVVYGDPEVMRFVGAGRPRSRREVAEALTRWARHEADHGFTLWVAVERATGEPIGGCGLIHLDGGREIEVAYHLRRDRWGRGYATEAARACVAYGFDTLGLERICGVTHPDNAASQKVLLNCGLRDLGTAFRYRTTVRYFAIAQAGWRSAPEAARGV